MNTDDEKKKQVLYHAQRTMYFNDLLIKQCDSWLSEEEGLRNVERRIRERNKSIENGKLKIENERRHQELDKHQSVVTENAAQNPNRWKTVLRKLRIENFLLNNYLQ